MSSITDVMKQIRKDFGVSVASEGVSLEEEKRLPTGLFPFDLASGGGFPRGRISVVYGPESSLKTSLCLRAIGMLQKAEPDKKCVFVDVEASYNPDWGGKLGVDNSKLIYVLPDYAEQAVDVIEAFLYAEDVGIVVVDSLAALITTNEAESSADKASVGGSGLVVGKLYRKATLAMSKARKEGREPTLIAINQIRFKIGVGPYANPETLPGGVAFKFASSLTVRLYGKDVADKKLHSVMPAHKHCSGIIQKWKVPILARVFEFDLGTIDNPDAGVEVGVCNDWATVKSYASKLGDLVNIEGKQGWSLFGTEFKTLDEIKNRLRTDPEFSNEVKMKLIVKMQAGTASMDSLDDK